MNLKEAFTAQAETCTRMGSPFTGRLLSLLAEYWQEDSALGQKFAEFTGDIGPAGHSLPLRVAGGLHALMLSGADETLAGVYPPNAPDNAAFAEAVLEALKDHEPFLLDWTNSPPQTNEVRRSAALIAGAHVAADHFDLPFYVSELGASGGLNLMWDHYALEIAGQHFGPAEPVIRFTPDWDGARPPKTSPQIAERAGVDLNPLDPARAEDLLRLTAYLWPDQQERMIMTRAAAAIATGPVERGDAIDWLADRLTAAPEGHLHFIQHTVAWQYFPEEAQERGTKLIETAGTEATPERPLAWLSMETDGDRTGKVGAALKLRLWPGDLTLDLGRADFHGRWINWTYA
jgi:hypothetical protein